MAFDKLKFGKGTLAAILVAVCLVLVYRNFIVPAGHGLTESLSPRAASGGPEVLQQGGSAARTARSDSSRGDKAMDQEELAALDPTLRLDLLERTASINYQGSARNIFQFYTPPPPKPVANPIVTAPSQTPPSPPPPPPPPAIALKFYGMASRQGSSEKKAFLTDGDEIFIGQEGDVVGKHYKIVRIGVNSLEWEDTINHQHGQLPLVLE